MQRNDPSTTHSCTFHVCNTSTMWKILPNWISSLCWILPSWIPLTVAFSLNWFVGAGDASRYLSHVGRLQGGVVPWGWPFLYFRAGFNSIATICSAIAAVFFSISLGYKLSFLCLFVCFSQNCNCVCFFLPYMFFFHCGLFKTIINN